MTCPTDILFPIETINREIDFRLMLAVMCAASNKRIWVGSCESAFQSIEQMNGGLYVGKNIRPTALPDKFISQKRYRILKEHGISMLWLDEEGGIFWGPREDWEWTMLQSLAPEKLAADDRAFAWGNLQGEFYRLRAQNSDAIQVTGHPRFDLYKKDYRSYYDAEVATLRAELGDFVLINTNFHRVNTVSNLSKIFGQRNQLDPRGYDHMEAIEKWSQLLHVFDAFVRAAARIAREFPHLNVIIRPHPSENIKQYETIFSGVPNVQVRHDGAVGPWLLAAGAVIHHGCTTAVEAHFCGTPTINYKPIDDALIDCELPNSFGIRCRDEAEALRAVSDAFENKAQAHQRVESFQPPDFVRDLIANFDAEAFTPIVAQINAAADALPANQRGLQKMPLWKNWLARQKPTSTSKNAKETGMLPKFYGLNKVDISGKMKSVQTLLNKDVRHTIISDELMLIES